MSRTLQIKRVDVLGAPVDCVDMRRALEFVDMAVSGDAARVIIAVNPEKIMKARTDPVLRRFLWNADLLIPDGIGVVFGARLLAGADIERVPGAELMPAICERAATRGYTVFLYGAAEEVNSKAAEVLAQSYPGLRIVGRQNGYVKDAEMPAFVARINTLRPDVLFVALGSPRQEIWFERWLSQLQVKVCQGVGGTFDVLAGKVRRAPPFFRNNNLEWFYRLVTEPRRAARQAALPKFAVLLVRQLLSGSRAA